MLGEESIHHYQQILQEHWGSGDTAVLLGDDVQYLLLRVTIIPDDFLECQSFHQILFKELSLISDSNDVISISCQSSTGISTSS